MNERSSVETSLIYIAVSNICEPMVKALLARGADVNIPDMNGSTPLHRCACTGYVPVIQFLVEVRSHCQSLNSFPQIIQVF